MAKFLLATPIRRLAALVVASYVLPTAAQAVTPYKIDTVANIKESARTLAYDTMTFYVGNQTGQTPGILPGPPSQGLGDYYWWEGGAMMGTYIDYWHLTNDSSYNHVIMQGMLHQVGPDRDYQPPNHTQSLGNDDQGFWGMSAMLAAENRFPDPPEDQPQWLALAQAVWQTQANPERHDGTCGGGLRWQIPTFNIGYDYKNTIANACFFDLGARLARYTGNHTYAKHAEKTWDWLWDVGYIDNQKWHIYDGAHVHDNCTDMQLAQFSYNSALLLHGAAFMYNYTDIHNMTEDKVKWEKRIDKLLSAHIEVFFDKGNNAAFEVACETNHGCSTDMKSFKGYVHRWLAVVSQLVPSQSKRIRTLLRMSTEKAIAQCTGAPTGRRCGLYWREGVFHDPMADVPPSSGAGESMNVLAAVSSLLIDYAKPPATADNGGTSKGDPLAGTRKTGGGPLAPISSGDQAGAGILTFLILAALGGTFGWMSLGE